MFSRTSAIAMLSLSLLAAATTTPTTPASQCNTANLSCCNSAQESDALTGPVKSLLQTLGISLGSLTGVVGVTCSPLAIVGGGSSCTAQPVCCSNNSFHGIVAIGCTPVNVGL